MKPQMVVVSTNAWRDNGSINTLIELLKPWDPERVAQIYTKSELPNTTVCTRFFQISEEKVLKSVFNRRLKTGREVSCVPDTDAGHDADTLTENKRYTRAGSSFLLSIAREFVWILGKWRTAELDAFLREICPKVLLLPVYPTIYMGLIQLYVKKKTGVPSVCYLADDNYTYKAVGNHPLKLIHRFFLRRVVKALVSGCEKLLVIAPKQKEEYDRIFGVNSEVVTKSIDPIPFVHQKPHSPIRMLYTGKLIIGRGKTLAMIADQLRYVNRDGIRIALEIYAPDNVTGKLLRRLNENGCTLHKPVSHSEVLTLQKNADILVFAEGLDKKNRNTARLSFSTKLTDYLQSGKCIFAVGAADIAPIDYLRSQNAAILAHDASGIRNALNRFANQPECIALYGKKAHDTGICNHNRTEMEQKFVSAIKQVCQEDVSRATSQNV